MITEIGIVAGEIWHYLDETKEMTLSDVVRRLGKPKETVLMSVGWLAREGHVVLVTSGDDYKISLRRV